MGRRKRKPKIIESIEFQGIADKGKSVGRDAEGRVIFAEDVAPGDIADVLIIKKKSSYMVGVPTHFHKYSEDRVEPFCEHFGVCGGCRWQHISYESQLHHKDQMVRNILQRIGKVDIQEYLPILGAEKTTYYRNKLEFSFSNKRWLTKEELNTDISNVEDVLGFHRPGAFDKILNIHHCWLQGDPSNELRNTLKALAVEQELSFYDARANEGFLRNVVIRLTDIGELLVILSFHENDQAKITRYLDSILEKLPQITSLFYCINPKVNDFILDLDFVQYYGKSYIEEQLGHVRFRIGPKSFFQTNTSQAKRLYDIVVEFADLKGTENVYDLYTGLGSIALYVAQSCRQVVGIEEIKEAIDDANINAELNDINNAIFYAGDVKDILTPAFAEKHGKPDLLITDPPRAGMHPKVVEMLLQLEAPRMVYVSCNPATLARDLNILSEKYQVLKTQTVDMFPHTHHMECVALLELKGGIESVED